MASEGYTDESSNERDKSFSVLLLSETQIQEIEKKLATGVSLKNLAEIAPLLGLKVSSIDDVEDKIVLEGEDNEDRTISDVFSTSEYVTFIENAIEQSRTQTQAESAGENGEAQANEEKKEQRLTPQQRLQTFIEEEVLKDVPEGEKLADTFIQKKTIAALRSFGGEYRDAVAYLNEENKRVIRIGFPGLERTLTHEEAIALLRKYANDGKKPLLPRIPQEKLAAFIEYTFRRLPEDAKIDEDRNIPDETVIAFRALGREFANALRESEQGIRGIRYGFKGKEKFITHTEAIRMLRNYAKRERLKAERNNQRALRVNDGFPEFDENSSIPDLPSNPYITGAPDLMALDVLESEDQTIERKDSSFPPHEEESVLRPGSMDAVRDRTRVALDAIASEGRIEPPAEPTVEVPDRAGFTPVLGEKLPKQESVSNAKVKTEDKKEEKSPETFDGRFTSEFGITKEDLADIDGFDRLSLPQQKLVFENLKEYAERGADGYLGAVWSGIKGAFENKGDRVPRQGSKGMSAYGEELKILIYSADKFGPKAHEEDGALRADFVGMQFDREHRNEQKQVVDSLNMAAHAFARTPASWQEDGNGVHAKDEWKITTFMKERVFRTDTRKQYREYEARLQLFEEAKTNFASTLEATGVPRGEIVKKLIEIDAQVHKLRFIETDPEAAALLERAPESAFKKIGSMMAQGALYSGIGAAGRMATAHVLNFLGSPVVAASLAGTRSWNKTAAEQRERDRKARLGIETDTQFQTLLQKTKDTYKKDPKGLEYMEATEDLKKYQEKNTALNIVSASQTVEISGEKRDVGITQKLENALNEYKQAYPDLLEKLENAKAKRDDEAISHYQEQLDKKFENLKARTTYSYDKLKLNRIQFGDKDTFAKNQAKFFETLAAAQILIQEQDPNIVKSGGRLEERLASFLDVREGAINDRRHKEQFKKVAIASSIAGGLALAGALAVEEYKTGAVGEKLKEWFGRSSASFSPSEGLMDAELGNHNTTVPYARTEGPSSAVPHAEAPSSAPEGIKETYGIKKGDTLIKIVQSELSLKTPDGKSLNGGAVLRLLKQLTPEELEKVGVKGGNIDRIFAGKNLNLEELNKALLTHGDGIQAQDLGDFRGAQYEMDSDILNKASVIREMEVTIPDVSEMPNEYPSGGETTAESPKPTEAVDSLTQKKAEIYQDYFFKVNKLDINSEVWKSIKNEDPQWYRRPTGIPPVQWKEFGPLIHIVDEVRRPPFNLIERPGETVEKFTRRMFVEIAKRNDSQFTPELRELLNQVHKSASYT